MKINETIRKICLLGALFCEYLQTDCKKHALHLRTKQKTTTTTVTTKIVYEKRERERKKHQHEVKRLRQSRCRQIRNYLCVSVCMNTSENMSCSWCVYILCAVVCHKNKIVIIARGDSVCLSFFVFCFIVFFFASPSQITYTR